MTDELSLYQHAKRPEWGYSAIVETCDDRTTFLFDDGQRRTLMREYVHLMTEVELPEEDAAEVHRSIAKHAARRTAPTRKKAAAKAPAAKKTAKKATKKTAKAAAKATEEAPPGAAEETAVEAEAPVQ